MDRNTDINFSNQPTEQRSSSIDRSAYSSAEAQRAQTTLHPGGTLQSSDIGLGTETMVPRKQQDIPRNVNGFDLFHLNIEQQPTFNDPDKRHTFVQTQETPDVRARKTSEPSVATQISPPPRYAANQQRRSVPYDETISFFGDSNATDNKHYPSRSLLDQDGLHRGSIGTLPHAGDSRERRRSSALSGSGEQQRDSLSTPMHRTSSALSGAGDFLPREESSTTPAMNDVPIGDKALHPEDKVSAAPAVIGNLPSTHEPAGLLPQSDQTPTPQSPTVNQGASTHQPLEGEDKNREKSYSEMASEAAANVTATAKGAMATVATGATAAAAALFGTKNDEERAKRESNVEPAIHGQEADYDSKDKVRRESAPDDQHPFCKSVHEPVIHGQTACYHCVKTDDEKAQVKPSAAEITGTAAALGAAGTVGTAGAVLVTPDPIGTSSVIEDDDSDIDHILKRPANTGAQSTGVQPTGIQSTDQPTEWAGQPYPATDGVLVADKHNFGLNRPLPSESNNESMSSTRAINGDPITEEDEIKQRASTAPTDKTIESPSEHQQNRRSSLTAGLRSKAAAGGAAFASAFRRLSHGPSSPTETDRRVSDAEAFKQQQQMQHHHHVHGADKAIDTEKQVNNYAIPEDVMKARENNRQLEEDYGKNYPKKEFTRQSGPISQSPQVVPTDIDTPYDTRAVGESGFTHGSDRATGPTGAAVADTAGASAVGASAGATAAANADANKTLENITPSRPREEVTTTSSVPESKTQPATSSVPESKTQPPTSSAPESRAQPATSAAPESRTQPATISPTNSTNTWTTAPMVADQPRHAFGGSYAFGNRDIVAPVQQGITKVPGIESMKVADVPGQTEGQDNFVKGDNEQRRTSRKGSIQKVIGKIFHK
ncbi:hypothetical protein G6F70_008997 [Rhizopus microsporus]|uniref:Uncharacterized protein n=1 Tax=Rhizopus microsporus TaxID=58291 RepID=A0A1X0SE53_RHIZD|nr:hypothetical protein G6F71_008960 [Rhizopus microsporus]KAG1193860.1 hypothetical protein G6F70_008997 [Rhizopus microsporus]KAG1206256.1 hypothetical protein G6F69_008967 [Rhizopus microsporus]KAG1226487.1 hypothetical protein G6F67_008962 [Rhizopus microsporus]KAG1258099.1 hypothetical protein G6F68_008953 [Rhizopus microsporus]